jgi:hypothetical protein
VAAVADRQRVRRASRRSVPNIKKGSSAALEPAQAAARAASAAVAAATAERAAQLLTHATAFEKPQLKLDLGMFTQSPSFMLPVLDPVPAAPKKVYSGKRKKWKPRQDSPSQVRC